MELCGDEPLAHPHFGMWATGLVKEVTGTQPAPWFAWNSRIFIYSAYSKIKWPSQTKILRETKEKST